ncbi:MAG: H+/Na+-translocating ferredoxin:NAD+ oxidoreductase subunit [Verrucomicrobiota bacterium]|jgi:electron transport complex protein RnfE|nr:H+/Na+-translocating ferredoxin:NAD+ oxidoreductase subunit [Verrucomicrobiota bacterium]MDK2963007.1 H+/Na+-translocating ferredoxin:NAD+ oxidoreductase subunit [Verrucomicrobiota bacterium]
MNLFKEFSKGIFKENPTFVLLLGMCPTLAVTNNAINGCSMGLATLFVLAGSNVVISLIRNVVPKKVRIPCYIVVIATFVTVVDLLMQAYAPSAIYEALGIFIPLIVVNCIVLGRAEAFASKNGILASLIDALGMGLGFTLSLTLIGGLRELLATGSLFQIKLIEGWKYSFMLMNQAPGAFILLGILLGIINWNKLRKAKKDGRDWTPPGLDCSQCNLCDLGKR